MMTPDNTVCAAMRLCLADIARQEAQLALQGDESKGGSQIEKYLCLLRSALGQRETTQHLADSLIGFDWCGAFVYYCCRQAGFTLSARPSTDLPGTFAAVFIWREWALRPENNFFISALNKPQPGDLVIFDHLLEDVACDHIGVVLAVNDMAIQTAEGNVENRAGLFWRQRDTHIHGYIRLQK